MKPAVFFVWGFLAASLVHSSTLRADGEGVRRGTARGTSSAENTSAPGSGGLRIERRAVSHPLFMSPHVRPIAYHRGLVFVTNTPADTVDVIDARSREIRRRIPVGIEPVCVAVRPDGKEVWVANHVSDSVSVIDSDPESPTFLHVAGTIQDFDRESRSTRFDEPAGIAFAGNGKAYIALSSENQIAAVDVASRRIVKRLKIRAQDPRAIAARDGLLYVLPFESNNKTQLSGGSEIDGDLVTFNAWEHSIRVNNVLSLGHVVDIVKHPRVPDRDLFIFDTQTDELVEVVDTLGTLLYGVAVDSRGRVYVAQTDARNDANGRAGTKKHGLRELENRAFLNRITRVRFEEDGRTSARSSRKAKVDFFELEPLPPRHPKPDEALATPYAIELSPDESLLVATAAASDKLFTVDPETGQVLGRVEVGAVPRGIALEGGSGGVPLRAWVYNAADDSVCAVDLSDPRRPRVEAVIPLEDPTPEEIRRGRVAFETAKASTTETFACASCHPDAHTDQLLWVLDTPIVTGGDQIMPRSTMPVRGLRDTEPYHWDGIPGDPYGGINSASIYKSVPPNCDAKEPESCARNLIDGGLATTMRMPGDETVNDEGKPGKLSAAERDALAKFILSVPYPPAQRRAYTNAVSERAREGFRLFHIEGDLDPTKSQPNVCGDCHRMPFLVSTNTPGTGMDAPTWRGAYDRFLILPQGRLNIIDFPFYRAVAEEGFDERSIWRFSWGGRERFDPVWDMVLEGSTGFPGAFARQVTLNARTAGAWLTGDLLDALELAAREESIVLQGEGVLIEGGKGETIALQFEPQLEGGVYAVIGESGGAPRSFARKELLSLARAGRLVVTFTGHLGAGAAPGRPQPALWTPGPIAEQRGRQEFPVLAPDKKSMTVSGRHIEKGAFVLVDGRRVEADIELDEGERVTITLAHLPPPGMHLLQVQNPGGLASNDFIFHVSEDLSGARNLGERTLGALLESTGWNRLLGTWVDAETKGKRLVTTYRWKIKDRVIEVTSIEPGRRSAAILAVNARTGRIFQAGADSTGGSHLGEWTFQKGGEAVLQVGFTGGDGREGRVAVRYRLEGSNALAITLEFPQPIRVRLVRARESSF